MVAHDMLRVLENKINSLGTLDFQLDLDLTGKAHLILKSNNM